MRCDCGPVNQEHHTPNSNDLLDNPKAPQDLQRQRQEGFCLYPAPRFALRRLPTNCRGIQQGKHHCPGTALLPARQVLCRLPRCTAEHPEASSCWLRAALGKCFSHTRLPICQQTGCPPASPVPTSPLPCITATASPVSATDLYHTSSPQSSRSPLQTALSTALLCSRCASWD